MHGFNGADHIGPVICMPATRKRFLGAICHWLLLLDSPDTLENVYTFGPISNDIKN